MKQLPRSTLALALVMSVSTLTAIAQVTVGGGAAMVTDDNGGTAKVTIADLTRSNGVIHVVDKVLLPR